MFCPAGPDFVRIKLADFLLIKEGGETGDEIVFAPLKQKREKVIREIVIADEFVPEAIEDEQGAVQIFGERAFKFLFVAEG